MLVGYTLSDPNTGHRTQVWAYWFLSRGTTPAGLLEKCNVYDGPGRNSKRLRHTQLILDISTVPEDLLHINLDTGEDSFILKLDGRDEWVEHFGRPEHWGGVT